MRRLIELTSRGVFALTAVSCLVLATNASANYASGFENLAGSAAGVVLTGQDGWFNPVAGSADYKVYTYAGNALAMPQNPTGQLQFIGGVSGGGTAVARAQRAEAFPNPPSGTYTFAIDICGGFAGTPPATNNLGSFSIQPSSATAPNGTANHLFSWVPGQEGLLYRSFYLVYDASGAADLAPGRQPGPEWDNLTVYHWYRITSVVDFSTNQIIEARIKDLSTNLEAAFFPPDWYMFGGSAGAGQQPTGYRCFTGGGLNNQMGYDNIDVHSGQVTPVQAKTWGGIKSTFLADTGRRAAPAQGVVSPVWPSID